jgi:hypothetical protein
MPPPCIDGIIFRRWHGLPRIFVILVMISSFLMWFQSFRSVEFLQQGLFEESDTNRSSDTIAVSTNTTTKLRKVAALSETLSLPYNPSAGNFVEENMKYVATIKEEVFTRPDQSPATPNFFEILKQKDCLPEGWSCLVCLMGGGGGGRADCGICRGRCGCFCKALCREKIESKFVSKQLTVTLPSQSRDSNRIIPRIVHQTW